ncbi:Eukaryotic/viral aspartic protease [Phytophthora megakarya]|uniref:Eukaryotic/viral aspartic protease n=1 Tax=Phytophthora megakarya TaxID=4795 RepID=A0A225W6B3_9STRA|nr:Eukaryotic/viral aspartic protease [Phytophthora megakarya]
MVQLQERPEVVEVFLAARRAATPKPAVSALQVKGPTDVPVTTSVEETGTVGTKGVGTQVDFHSSCGYDASDRCSCVSDQLAKPGVRDEDSDPSTAGGAEDSERLRSVTPFQERGIQNRPEHFASETNDDSEFVPEFDSEDVLEDVLESALDDFSSPMDDASDLSDTPVQRLEREYERVMRVTVEELDLELAVYLREETELLAQLSGYLTMFPELEELSLECDIDKADVGIPGVTTPEMEEKMRKILNYHRRIFLGDGNAAPAPARGVVCDLDVGDAMPIALHARQIASRYLVKVYELLE